MVEDLRSYYGIPPNSDGSRPASVNVRPKGQTSKPLPLHARHGTGHFGWGTSDNNSLDTALSILFDAFGIVGPCATYPMECKCTSVWVDDYYKAFRDAKLFPLKDIDEFKLDQTQITDWVFDYSKALLETVPV